MGCGDEAINYRLYTALSPTPGPQLALCSTAVQGIRVVWFLPLQEAVQSGAFLDEPFLIQDCNGDPLEGACNILEGEFQTGTQKPMYMETQSCIAVPKGESGEMDLFISTQAPGLVQVCDVSV